MCISNTKYMKRTQKIVLFGGSFNPPGRHHETIVKELSKRFDRVIVIPCGTRSDKAGVDGIATIHRAAMVDLAFGRMKNVRVDLFDLEHNEYTRTIDLDRHYRGEGEVWHAIGADLVQEGSRGCSVIQQEWKEGKRLWDTARFAVVQRRGYPWRTNDLPPQTRVIPLNLPGSSTEIRELLFNRKSISRLVSTSVSEYIFRHGLYNGIPNENVFQHSIVKPRIELIVDERNPASTKIAKKLRKYESDHPSLIVALGGDGMMIHAIRKHWRRRLPFLGLHTGTVGFLMNHLSEKQLDTLFKQRFHIRQSPLLHVEGTRVDGTRFEANAFNDAWVERKSGQAAWVEVNVNGQTRIPRLIGDGVLMSTAAGSTAYARAMGATPLHVDSPALLLMGSNVYVPQNWKSAHLPLSTVVELKAVEPNKRPLSGFVDGIPEGDVLSLKIRVSRIAAAELLFLPGNEISEKLTKIQFPADSKN